MPEVYDATPEAYEEFESLRGLGYEPKEAIADLIDNSIKAEANKIRVTLFWDGKKSWIAIRDNGEGFTPKSIMDAMTLYKKTPSREKTDLGQFGMGLKTASISMGRRLTVITKNTDDKKETLVSVLDLDHQKKQRYQILARLQAREQKIIDDHNLLYGMNQGTCILITDLDRLLETEKGRLAWTEKQMLALSDKIENHLGMIFHRFIDVQGKEVKEKIKIHISATSEQGSIVAPWNPFSAKYLSKPHPDSWTTSFSGEKAKYKGYIMKTKKALSQLYDEAGGPDGWLAQQGFYIYRRNRMLVYGSWLGLKNMRNRKISKNIAHNLVRIKLDLSDKLAKYWKVDIMKTKVKPPDYNHLELRRSASQLMASGRQALYGKSNSQKKTKTTYPPLWKLSTVREGEGRSVKLSVVKSHPLIKSAKENLIGVDQKKLGHLIDLLSASIPVSDLLIEMQGDSCSVSLQVLSAEEKEYLKMAAEAGIPKSQAMAMLEDLEVNHG